jgi:hypothetical protein
MVVVLVTLPRSVFPKISIGTSRLLTSPTDSNGSRIANLVLNLTARRRHPLIAYVSVHKDVVQPAIVSGLVD